MKLQLIRYRTEDDYTAGALFFTNEHGESEFMCYTLEDEYRKEKVSGETRIPEGEYRLTLRTEGGLHSKYGRRFPGIHKGMLWLRDVPGFKWIYLHCGNTDDDTDGCPLVGDSQGPNFVGHSRVCYQRIYPIIAAAIQNEGATIEIQDFA